jgi:ribonuclease HI
LIHPKKRAEFKGGFRKTTNNRMEIFAAIKGLELLKQPCVVNLYSDSKYLVDSMTLGWAANWKKKNWWRTSKERAENFDLWERLLDLCAQHEVKFEWVRGHAGNIENECCDRLSCAAIREPNLAIDEGYENKPANGEGRPKPKEGEPCWKCATPVLKRQRKPKPGQEFFNEFFLQCPACDMLYELDEFKVTIQKTPTLL